MEPLAHLNNVDWSSLSHAYGVATDVPDALRALVSRDPELRQQALDDLLACLDHQGVQRFEATLRAVPFFVGLIADPDTPDRGALARALAELALGDTWWFQHDGFHPELQTAPDDCSRPRAWSSGGGGGIEVRAFPTIGEGHDMSTDSGLRWIYDAVAAEIPVYLEALTDADAELRASLAYLLAWLTPHATTTAPALQRLCEDQSVTVRAAAWLALSHATKFDPTLCADTTARLQRAWASDPSDPLERRCVALALVRLEDPASSGSVMPALHAWIRSGVPAVIPDEAFPWARIDATPFVFCTTYIGSAPEDREAVVDAATQGLVHLTEPHDATDLARWLIDLRVPANPDATELVPGVRAVLQALCGCPSAWRFAETAMRLRDRGLPGTPDALRRWLD